MKHPPVQLQTGLPSARRQRQRSIRLRGASARQGRPRSHLLLNFSGNDVTLYPSFNEIGDLPGAMAAFQTCAAANVCGNILRSGGYGVAFYSGCSTNAVILNNNMASATYEGIGLSPFGGSLQSAYIFSNVIGQGVTFHLQMPYSNSFGWFVGSNIYTTNLSTQVPLFTDPASTAIHIFQ